VVSRETSSVFVIDHKEGKIVSRVNIGQDLRHAVIKFRGKNVFLLTRDGYIISISSDFSVADKIKVGESSIGFDFICDDVIAVANYQPGGVVILNLKDRKTDFIETNSRVVGIKVFEKGGKTKLIFSLMDKGEIHIYDVENCRPKQFKKLSVKDVIFDAFLYSGKYIYGLWKKGSVGVLNLEDLSSHFVSYGRGEQLFKVPHFGSWAEIAGKIFIPNLGIPYIVQLDVSNLQYKKIEVCSSPVFVVSNMKNYLAVNYSGECEDVISLLIFSEIQGEITGRKDFRLGRRILHMRFFDENPNLMIFSSYFEDRVKVFDIEGERVVREYEIPTPSGIFLSE
jgi:protein NirF